ncbi:MAG: hypothetical protein ACO3BD_03685 [Chitinophagaceae bacterium]
MIRKFLSVFVLFSFCSLALQAQVLVYDTMKVEVPLRRQMFHDRLDKEQKRVDKLDGKVNEVINLFANEDLNVQITDAMLRKVDEIQFRIERDPNTDNNAKIRYVTALEKLLVGYGNMVRGQTSTAAFAPELLSLFQQAMAADMQGASIAPVIAGTAFEAGEVIADVFSENVGAKDVRKIIFLKKCALNPKAILKGITAFEGEAFADSLLSIAGRKIPMEVYTYAQAVKSREGIMIRASKDLLVKTIADLSTLPNGTLYLPFLDELITGKMQRLQVQGVIENEPQYYKLLVKTQISYFGRIAAGDTPVLASALTDMLQRKATDVFVNVMNYLHDAPEATRFKIVENLNPQEIYYLIVNTEEVIYTSTYTNLYKRMMDRFPGRRGDSLLMTVRFDRFKKFIKMSANYNTLDQFLQTMPELNNRRLMYAFVNGLQRTNSLEDAVDVADSYGSILNRDLQYFLMRQVESNLENSQKLKDRKGEAIYQILATLFRSASDSTVNLSATLGIPPVYSFDARSLQDDSGRVVQQVFFYGDEDGVMSFRSFMSLFNNKPDWKVETGKEWVTIRSVRGRPTVIYANLPLDYKQDLDALAQANLIAYLKANKLQPTVVVHRGHSYHLKYTLQQMMSSSRIVMLGSCGGYQNLSRVLNINNDAHIISTKQVGTFTVNDPILRLLNDYIINGRNIEWKGLWQQLYDNIKSDAVASRYFNEYIPPHKNLGAIFIKAYRRSMGEM